MPTIGVIAEGPTDQTVIENILLGYFEESDDDTDIRFVQPSRPLGEDPGGWGLVFKSLERKDHEGALQFSDFLVIHIDTDVQEEGGFDVPRRENGVELELPDRIDRVIARLKQAMTEDFLATNGHRVVFAIAVDSIECWLLPHCDSQKAGKITGCLEAVNNALRKLNQDALSNGNRKFIAAYESASSHFRKRKRLLAVHDKNPSLKIFVDALNAAVPKPAVEPKSAD